MPDCRRHRGPHPRDAECFAPECLADLRNAVHDLFWLLGRGYAEPSSLKLVGDRYRLVQRQRMAVSRAVAHPDQIARRRQRRLELGDLASRELLVDGFNCCITVEVAESGGVVLRCLDESFRDLASVHGSYRRVEETPRAIEWLLDALESVRPGRVHLFFDRPVSNSGRLAAEFRRQIRERALGWEASVVDDADAAVLEEARRDPGAVALSTDGQVLDSAPAWFDVAGLAIRRCVPRAWVVDLGMDAVRE